jgi:hypothetical protein
LLIIQISRRLKETVGFFLSRLLGRCLNCDKAQLLYTVPAFSGISAFRFSGMPHLQSDQSWNPEAAHLKRISPMIEKVAPGSASTNRH